MPALDPIHFVMALLILALLASCTPSPIVPAAHRPQAAILVEGRAVAVGGQVRVVRWSDPAGLDAYHGAASRNFGVRDDGADPPGPTAALNVQQIVIHYDAIGDSRQCFAVLQRRGLSAHFLIDRDGTIYQTLDVRERAYHATLANNLSVGVEIAHEGAFAVTDPSADAPPASASDLVGDIQNQHLRQQPFTDAQYHALAALVASLRRAFPQIALDVPRAADGSVIAHQLPRATVLNFRGLLGHYHVQSNKIDPGPALAWDRLLRDVRAREEGP
jgi:N-acetyl-anhydromuramyl-L-alanine amidase AmpD